jgi:hypothetical protein
VTFAQGEGGKIAIEVVEGQDAGEGTKAALEAAREPALSGAAATGQGDEADGPGAGRHFNPDGFARR